MPAKRGRGRSEDRQHSERKMKKKPTFIMRANSAQGGDETWDNDEAPIPGVDYVAETPRQLIREAFILFCVPTSRGEVGEEKLIQKRERYITKLICYLHENRDKIGLDRDKQLLVLIGTIFQESSYNKIISFLRRHEADQFPISICDDESKGFVHNQREYIIEHLKKLRAKDLTLHDGRKVSRGTKPGKYRFASYDVSVVELLRLCYRRIKEETMASPVVHAIEEKRNALRQIWRACLLDEKKRERKSKGRGFRAGRDQQLTHLEMWLFKYWADPRLPLCVLSLEDTMKAANLSPESRSANQPKTTSDAIRKLIERVGLKRTSSHFATNVRQLKDNWPPFDYDTPYNTLLPKREDF